MVIFSSAFANNEAVPGNILLLNLPQGSRIVVKSNISVESSVGNIHQKILYGKFSGVLSEKHRKIKAEDIWPIKEVSIENNGAIAVDVTPDMSPLGSLKIWFSPNDGKIPTTVADFARQLGSYFQIIYDDPADDPYQGMEKSEVKDLVMPKITTALMDNNYIGALPHFAQLAQLGINLPESFYYYYAEALEKTEMWERAYILANNYLESHKNKSKYYAQIYGIYSEAFDNIK